MSAVREAEPAADLDAVAVFLRESGHEDAAGPPRAQDTSDATVKLDAVVSFLRDNGYSAAADLVRATFPWRRLGAYVGDMMRRMPPDTLAFVASWATRGDLLALRAAFAAGRDAAHHAVTSHPDCREFDVKHDLVPTLAIEAIGRVFGKGCRRLKYSPKTPVEVSALQSFVVSTDRGLEELAMPIAQITLEMLLVVCRATPRLKKLYLRFSWSLLESANILEIATQVTQLCPMLSCVELPKSRSREMARSPVEEWAFCFPKLTKLDFGTGFVEYRPTLYSKIQESIARCSLATDVELCACIVQPPLVDLLVHSPLGTRLARLSLAEAQIADETIIDAARGLFGLRDLVFPCDFQWRRQFSTNLHLARPEIERLEVGYRARIDDTDIGDLCDAFRLRFVKVGGGVLLNENAVFTPEVVDRMLASPSSITLEEVIFDNLGHDEIGSPNLLRLAVGCPSLKNITWDVYRALSITGYVEFRNFDASELGPLADLLKSRGGRLSTNIPEASWGEVVDGSGDY